MKAVEYWSSGVPECWESEHPSSLHHSSTPPLHHSVSSDDHRPPEIRRERAAALARIGIAPGQTVGRFSFQAWPRTIETFSLPLRTDLSRPREDCNVRL